MDVVETQVIVNEGCSRTSPASSPMKKKVQRLTHSTNQEKKQWAASEEQAMEDELAKEKEGREKAAKEMKDKIVEERGNKPALKVGVLLWVFFLGGGFCAANLKGR